MLFPAIEWRPASLCSYESTDNSFGGSVEAVAGGGGADFGGGGGSESGGGTNGTDSGDFGLGGPGPMQTTAADWGALGALAAGGFIAGQGMAGWGAATAVMAQNIAASFGTSLDVALGHLATDIANSMAWGGMGALGSGQ